MPPPDDSRVPPTRYHDDPTGADDDTIARFASWINDPYTAAFHNYLHGYNVKHHHSPYDDPAAVTAHYGDDGHHHHTD